MKRILLLILIGWFGMTGLMAQNMAFVSSAAANDNGDGLTWETAKRTIAAGLGVVGDNGMVCVKSGTYNISATLVIPAGVSLCGGYGSMASGTDTSLRQLPGLNSRWENVSICTIIIGDGTHRLASVSGLLEGCVMRRGYTDDKGGGVLIDGGTVRYCVIKECDAINETTFAAEGGGAYVRNGGLLTNCVITECRGDKGPAVSGGNGSLINNTITRNWPTHCGTVADYDGNVYNTVVIGQQCWTKQNMRTTHYNDGTAIPRGSENSSTAPYYYIDYNALTPFTLPNYGYLYNWKAATHGASSSSANPSGVTGVCPLGWHLPSDSEFVEMREFVNTILANRCDGYDYQIGKSLASRTDWSYESGCSVGNNLSSNNNTLFTAYPAGYYNDGFGGFHLSSHLWTTTQINSVRAVNYSLGTNSAYLIRNTDLQVHGFSVRCVKTLGGSDPVVHTISVNILPNNSAECRGSCSEGGALIAERGICWATSPNPTISGSHLSESAGEGAFSFVMTNLTAGVTYYVRTYVVNANGVFYGEERSFALATCGALVIQDFDGNSYNTIQLGEQCWMRENLRTTHYADGAEIPFGVSGYSDDLPYYYRNNEVDEAVYGLYYNWPALMNGAEDSESNPSGVQGVCPDGWHVPSNAEWDQLFTYVRSVSSYRCNGSTEYIAKALASQTGWSEASGFNCYVGNDFSTNNATGFTAMPAGRRITNGSYENVSTRAFFHTTTRNHWYGQSVYSMFLGHDMTNVNSYTDGYANAKPVRCVRNQ